MKNMVREYVLTCKKIEEASDKCKKGYIEAANEDLLIVLDKVINSRELLYRYQEKLKEIEAKIIKTIEVENLEEKARGIEEIKVIYKKIFSELL